MGLEARDRVDVGDAALLGKKNGRLISSKWAQNDPLEQISLDNGRQDPAAIIGVARAVGPITKTLRDRRPKCRKECKELEGLSEMITIRLGLAVSLLACICCPSLLAQHVPITVWDQVQKPGIAVPNPMDRVNQRSKTTDVDQSIGQPESEVHLVIENVTSGLSEKNLPKTLQSYWQGPELLVFWDSDEYRGGEAFSKGLQALMDSFQEVSFTMEKVGIRVFGRFGWLTATYHLEGTTGTGRVTHSGQTTWILEKRYNQWKIIHQHFSIWTRG